MSDNQHILQTRSQAMNIVRNTLHDLRFIEVETPILYKATPEGARDFLVPSRIHPHKVYALPQSPQMLKQLLMIGGTDRYFQICKCFRDEDFRADRQPEFTQIDIECSFAGPAYIKALAEKLLTKFYHLQEGFELQVMKYKDAMMNYGCDKPDIRFGLKHHNITDAFKGSDFTVFSSVADTGLIKAIFLPETAGTLARKELESLVEMVKSVGGKGMAWAKYDGSENWTSGIAKFITPQIAKALNDSLKENEGLEGAGTWLFFGDLKADLAHQGADHVRRYLGEKCELYNESDMAFIWIDEFPLFEYDDEDGRFYAKHHPFTMPHEEDKEKFLSGTKADWESCRAAAYDVVLNGYELGGGSARIYDAKIQEQMFHILGMDKDEVQRQFGFFVEALGYGTPPHAGIAFGLDRMVMLLMNIKNISDVIAFPKTTSATDLMSGAPTAPNPDQLKELSFDWNKK